MKNKNKSEKKKHQLVQKNISPDKIFPSRRQTLAELSFYPKSIQIDDHFLDHLHSNNNLTKSKFVKNEKIIKFIGDKNDNIKMIIQNFDSLRQAQNRILMKQQKESIEQQFSEILGLFYQKIQKIRKQRDFYKNSLESQKSTLVQQINQLYQIVDNLKVQISCLQKQKQMIYQKLQLESKKKNFFERQNSIIKQKLKLGSLNSTINPDHVNSSFEFVQKDPKQSMLISDDQSRIKLNFFHKQPQKSQSRSRNLYSILDEESLNNIPQYSNKMSMKQKQQLSILLKKHNLQPDQLCKIIQEYLEQLRHNHDIQLSSQEQKKLYFMNKKKDNKIKNKNIKKDIQKLMNIKEQIQTSKALKGIKY